MAQQILTHKGWFGLCPVYIGDIDDEGPFIDPRHWSLMWLMLLSAFAYQVIMTVCDFVGVECGGLPIKVTGELESPMTIEVE